MRKIISFLLLLALFSPARSQPVTAKSWLIADSHGKIVKGENTDTVRPIASISKLVAVMIVLDAKQDLNEQLIWHEATKKTSKKHKHKNKEHDTAKRLSRQELIDMALIHSDNHATAILCKNYPGGSADCISAMNSKVNTIGMKHTQLFDPTGLDNRNTSTAEDLVLLVKHARTYPTIIHASKQSKVEIKVKKKWIIFPNTNPLIGKDRRIIISKTGYTTPAGGCIVLGLDTEYGERTVVVLGSKNTRTRIPEAEFISNIEEQ